jgi:4-carboxymuconolactone decarboxylase
VATFPIDAWQERAEAVKQRLGSSGRPSAFAVNAMADLDPQFAELIQVIARGRSYADDTLDLKTRSLCTVACLVGLGEPRYVENWIQNAMTAGATRDEIVELMVQLFTYVGTPKAVAGFEAARAVFERGDEPPEGAAPSR